MNQNMTVFSIDDALLSLRHSLEYDHFNFHSAQLQSIHELVARKFLAKILA